jgi:hypothetical protein
MSELFRIGTKVRMTEKAIRQGLNNRGRVETGVVVGYSRKSADLVRVLKDGFKTSALYHVSFWRRV